jgi:hypothetical protein
MDLTICEQCVMHYVYQGKHECVMNDKLNPYKCPDFDRFTPDDLK